MQKKFLMVLGLILLSWSAFSADGAEFYGTIDFSINFEKLSTIINEEGIDGLPEGRNILLYGAIASMRILRDDENEPFLAEAKIVNGKWIGLEYVEIFSGFILFRGPDFEQRIRKPRERGVIEEEIQTNSEVIVIGNVVDTRETQDGKIVPILEAFYVRNLR
jgi:hypothetical protein